MLCHICTSLYCCHIVVAKIEFLVLAFQIHVSKDVFFFSVLFVSSVPQLQTRILPLSLVHTTMEDNLNLWEVGRGEVGTCGCQRGEVEQAERCSNTLVSSVCTMCIWAKTKRMHCLLPTISLKQVFLLDVAPSNFYFIVSIFNFFFIDIFFIRIHIKTLMHIFFFFFFHLSLNYHYTVHASHKCLCPIRMGLRMRPR